MLVEGNLPSYQPRQPLPGCIMLAALPHRRVAGERSAAVPAVTEAVCPNIIDAQQAGFTLVEMSIVLVIIGLVVGGVLVGRDLISAAAVRSQVSQIEKYNTAVNTFRGKYDCLPGDCKYASTLFPILSTKNNGWSAGHVDGNGDGILQDLSGNPNFPQFAGQEPQQFWEQLFAAGLTDCCQDTLWNDMGVAFPSGKVGTGAIAAIAINSNNGYFLGINIYTHGLGNVQYGALANSVLGVVTPTQAQAMDSKIDDGQATTGKIYAAFVWGGDAKVHPYTYFSGYNCTTNTTPPAYNISYTGPACSLFFQMQ